MLLTRVRQEMLFPFRHWCTSPIPDQHKIHRTETLIILYKNNCLGRRRSTRVRQVSISNKTSRRSGILNGPSQSHARSFATCFLVAPQLILTNHHVFGKPEDTVGVRIQFNYREQYSGGLAKVDEHVCDTTTFITDQDLDFTLVALTQPAEQPYLPLRHPDRRCARAISPSFSTPAALPSR
jgi:hypothetical protein